MSAKELVRNYQEASNKQSISLLWWLFILHAMCVVAIVDFFVVVVAAWGLAFKSLPHNTEMI